LQFNLVGWLLRIYIDALVKGNPIAVLFTAVMAVAISVGPFYNGLRERDPVAITMVCVFGGAILLALGIVVHDKRQQLLGKREKEQRARAFGQKVKAR
jgi:hypothetical protein